MAGPRPRPQHRTSSSRSARSGRPASGNRSQMPLRQPTDTIVANLRQTTQIPNAEFPTTPASIYGPSGMATHADMAGSINHAFQQQQQNFQSTRSSFQSGPQQSRMPQAPPAPPTSFHAPDYFNNLEYQERERMKQAAEALASREIMMRLAVMNNESIPQTRLRLQRQLVGVKHTPYDPPSEISNNTNSSNSSSSSATSSSNFINKKKQDLQIIRDMRPEEDDGIDTWAESEIVVGPGDLVRREDSLTNSSSSSSSII